MNQSFLLNLQWLAYFDNLLLTSFICHLLFFCLLFTIQYYSFLSLFLFRFVLNSYICTVFGSRYRLPGKFN